MRKPCPLCNLFVLLFGVFVLGYLFREFGVPENHSMAGLAAYIILFLGLCSAIDRSDVLFTILFSMFSYVVIAFSYDYLVGIELPRYLVKVLALSSFPIVLTILYPAWPKDLYTMIRKAYDKHPCKTMATITMFSFLLGAHIYVLSSMDMSGLENCFDPKIRVCDSKAISYSLFQLSIWTLCMLFSGVFVFMLLVRIWSRDG